jgi:hypothetical protein
MGAEVRTGDFGQVAGIGESTLDGFLACQEAATPRSSPLWPLSGPGRWRPQRFVRQLVAEAKLKEVL